MRLVWLPLAHRMPLHVAAQPQHGGTSILSPNYSPVSSTPPRRLVAITLIPWLPSSAFGDGVGLIGDGGQREVVVIYDTRINGFVEMEKEETVNDEAPKKYLVDDER